MAEARKNSERIVTVVENVILTLSTHEAESLATILRHVSGDRKSSPRVHSDSISRALRGAGVEAFRGELGSLPLWHVVSPETQGPRRHSDELLAKDSIGGGLRFKNYPAEWTERDRG